MAKIPAAFKTIANLVQLDTVEGYRSIQEWLVNALKELDEDKMVARLEKDRERYPDGGFNVTARNLAKLPCAPQLLAKWKAYRWYANFDDMEVMALGRADVYIETPDGKLHKAACYFHDGESVRCRTVGPLKLVIYDAEA